MTPLTRFVATITLPIALIISMTHLVGAEEGPGDGFTAGIISSLGLTLEYLAFGYEEARQKLRGVHFEYLLALGFAVTLLASVIPIFAGQPLLSIRELAFEIPLVGEVKLTRATLFDVGVYFVVLGGAMTAIEQLRAVE
ncbi:MAG: hypothetical protein M3220_06425 [Chloroflexota bacterium]|nr:hypothetical protein [Chloroflexota bacterium]